MKATESWSIGHFRVTFCLCFKTIPGAQPLLWKLVLPARLLSSKQRSIFNDIRAVWIADGTLSRVFDLSSQSEQKLRSKRRNKIVKIYANKDRISKPLLL